MITIIADSSVSLKKSEADLLGVRLIPMHYSVSGKSYLESYSDKNGGFEQLLASGSSIYTSQPKTAAFLACFSEELALGNEVLCITISSRLSGAYSSAHAAASQLSSDKITVFDSLTTAGGLYLLVKAARRMALRNMPLDRIVEELTILRMKTVAVFSVDDMNPLRNSGRLGTVRMSVGTFLNIKPILLCRDGSVIADGVAHGTPDIIRRMTLKLPQNVDEIVINYIRGSRLATHLHTTVRSLFPRAQVRLHKMGPVLGIHLGLNVVALCFISK